MNTKTDTSGAMGGSCKTTKCFNGQPYIILGIHKKHMRIVEYN